MSDKTKPPKTNNYHHNNEQAVLAASCPSINIMGFGLLKIFFAHYSLKSSSFQLIICGASNSEAHKWSPSQ